MNIPSAMKAIALLPITALLFGACSSMQPTTQVYDGVYDKPSREPLASTAPVQEPEPTKSDDYYDPGQASAQRSYYDMAYNDPHYYNYGRFGFGMGMNSWNNGWGYGMGYGSGWNQSYYGSGWGSPYGGYNNYWNDPYGNNGWGNGYGGGYYGGYGNPYGGYGYPYGGYGYPYNGYGYYGSGGNCYGCYQPIVICGGGYNTVVTHRPTMGSGSNGSNEGGSGSDGIGTPGASRVIWSSRSPVSLRPAATQYMRTTSMGTSLDPYRPAHEYGIPERGRNDRPSSIERRPAAEERRPSERPSMGTENRGGSTPSRSTDGGSRPLNGQRPR